MIDFERQFVRVRTSSGAELVITGERASHEPTLYSTARVRKYLQQGCTGLLAYVSNTRFEDTIELSRVPIVWDFPDVFPKDIPGVPPERQVKFNIDMVTTVALIATVSYRLAPPEM